MFSSHFTCGFCVSVNAAWALFIYTCVCVCVEVCVSVFLPASTSFHVFLPSFLCLQCVSLSTHKSRHNFFYPPQSPFHSSVWIFPLLAPVCICVFLGFMCTGPTDEIVSHFGPPSPPPPSGCYLRRTLPKREKIELFTGAHVRTPPGFMTNRRRLSLSRGRQSKRESGGGGWHVGGEKQVKVAGHWYGSFAYVIPLQLLAVDGYSIALFTSWTHWQLKPKPLEMFVGFIMSTEDEAENWLHIFACSQTAEPGKQTSFRFASIDQ